MIAPFNLTIFYYYVNILNMGNVTIKDIAKFCGVSTATVSYVINNNENHTISEETRKKILHAVNMLNYKPSVIAKNLRVEPQHKIVAIYTDECSEYLNRLEFFHFINKASKFFTLHNISLVYATKPFIQNNNADALLSFNLSLEDFRELGKNNYIPLIALDSLINDYLFFQVTTNYQQIKDKADKKFDNYTFISLTPSSNELKEKILNTFKNVKLISKIEELSEITDTFIATDSRVIYNYFSPKPECNVIYNTDILDKKIEQAYNCIEQALSHNQFDIHFYEI